MRRIGGLVLVLLCAATVAMAQQQKAYGVRAGLAAMNAGEGNHALLEAFYDVPMGDILFSPELVLITAHSEEPAYGVGVKIRRQLLSGGIGLIADVGAQFVVWDTITTAGGPPKRAHAGIPIDLSAELPLTNNFEFEATLTYTPMFFLGAQPYTRSLVAVLGGLRILVP